MIRTSGEMRLSNFLIWQTAYSEFYSTPVYWPDFDEAEIDRALEAYARAWRRFGGYERRLAQRSAANGQLPATALTPAPDEQPHSLLRTTTAHRRHRHTVLVGIVWVGGALLAGVVALAVAGRVHRVRDGAGCAAHADGAAGRRGCAARCRCAASPARSTCSAARRRPSALVSAAYTLSKDPTRRRRRRGSGASRRRSTSAALAAFFVLLREIGRRPRPRLLHADHGVGHGHRRLLRRPAIGKHKLAPAISPSKTIEGARRQHGRRLHRRLRAQRGAGPRASAVAEHRIALGLLLPPVIMVGDLAESALKRALRRQGLQRPRARPRWHRRPAR